MAGLLRRLGQMAGPKLRKGRWVWQSLTGTEQEVIEAEQETGADLAQAFEAELGLDPAPDLRRFVSEVGQSLVACVRDRKRQWKFTVVSGGEPNAFALPGGYVFITRSLLEMMQYHKDPLAFILGHEMGHVIKQHAMERMMSDTVISGALRAARLGGVAGNWVKTTGAKLMRSGYSQDRELEADRYGARLSDAAGYDPNAAISMFRQLKELTESPDPPPMAEYFASHPPFGTRIEHLLQFIDQMNQRRSGKS